MATARITITIRVTEEEYLAIKSQADARGVSVQRFLLDRQATGAVKKPNDSKPSSAGEYFKRQD